MCSVYPLREAKGDGSETQSKIVAVPNGGRFNIQRNVLFSGWPILEFGWHLFIFIFVI